MLTRQVAIGLCAAVLIDLCLRRRWSMARNAAIACLIIILPWLAWLAIVGREQMTQAQLLLTGAPGRLPRVLNQAWFYLQRIPDQITGPAVEVASVIRRSAGLERLASLWAVGFSGLIIGGWLVVLQSPRRRLAGLIPLVTLILLCVWPYTEAGRFLIPLVPFLLVGAVEGTSGLVKWGWRRAGCVIANRRATTVAAVLLLLVSVPYSGYSLVTGRTRAQDARNHTFDAACAWLARHGQRPGPVLTRHPGEVFLATGRSAIEVASAERPGQLDAALDTIAQTIAHYGVAYVLIDDERYLGEPAGPLRHFVTARPEEVKKVWNSQPGEPFTAIYEVLPSGHVNAEARRMALMVMSRPHSGVDQFVVRGPSNRSFP
jgi:hypothetical protein